MSDQLSDLSDREVAILRALPDPMDSGRTAVRIAELKGVTIYPEVDRLLGLGLAQRVARPFWKKTRAGVMWLREHDAAVASDEELRP